VLLYLPHTLTVQQELLIYDSYRISFYSILLSPLLIFSALPNHHVTLELNMLISLNAKYLFQAISSHLVSHLKQFHLLILNPSHTRVLRHTRHRLSSTALISPRPFIFSTLCYLSLHIRKPHCISPAVINQPNISDAESLEHSMRFTRYTVHVTFRIARVAHKTLNLRHPPTPDSVCLHSSLSVVYHLAVLIINSLPKPWLHGKRLAHFTSHLHSGSGI
jgi:hypothetical protein